MMASSAWLFACSWVLCDVIGHCVHW